MFRLFPRKPSAPKPPASSSSQPPQSFNMKALPILSAPQLLEYCGYDASLSSLFRAFGMSEQHFDVMVRRPMHRFAESVQLAPASENNHHCGPGGLLQHTLEVIEAALQVRRGYQLPIGGSPDVMAQEEHFWSYGVFVACLFHDIGKVLSRFQIVMSLPDGSRRLWTPHDIPLRDTGAQSYQIRFVESPYKAHQRMSVTLYGALLPRTARAWLMQNPAVMSQTLAAIWGDGYESEVIGEIVTIADRESTGLNTDITDMSRRFAGAKESVADRLIQKLRQLLSEREIKLNQSGAMGWVAGEHTYFVCRPLAERLIQAMKDAGEKGIPTDPVRIYDVLQEHGFALPYEDGKAIRKLRVRGEGWSHTLTCLKFATRRLWVPVRLPAAFDGELVELCAETDVDVSESDGAVAQGRLAPKSEPVQAGEPDREDEPEREAVIESEPASKPAEDKSMNQTGEENVATRECRSGAEADQCEPATNGRESVETENHRETADNLVIPSLTWDDNVGEAFWDWLRECILRGALPFNNQSASIHFVEEGVFIVTPRLFKDFCAQSGLGREEFGKLQKRFCRLKVHKKTARTNHNVHPYVVTTANRTVRLNGFLIPYTEVFETGAERPDCNKYLKPADTVLRDEHDTNDI